MLWEPEAYAFTVAGTEVRSGYALATADPEPIRLLAGHAAPAASCASDSLHAVTSGVARLNLVFAGNVTTSSLAALGCGTLGSVDETSALIPVVLPAL